MNIYKSPYNKLIKYNKYFLLFSGTTGNIYPISLRDYIKFKLNLLNKEQKKFFLSHGYYLPEKRNDFLLKVQGNALKDLSKANLSLVVMPTMHCNLKCSYCFVKKQLRNLSMETETIDKIIHLIGSNGGKYSIEWFGGEPTLRPDLMQYFYSESIKNGYKASSSLLITNGTFENKLCWEIIENYITSIQITIDGPTEIHDKRRINHIGAGSFDKIIANLDILYEKIVTGKTKNNISVIIRCNLDKDNFLSYTELLHFIQTRYHYRFIVEKSKVFNCGISDYDKKILSNKEYSNYIIHSYQKLHILDEPYLPDYKIKTFACRVQNPKSFIFYPNGDIYKCSLDVGENDRIIGTCNKEKHYVNSNCESKYLFATSQLLPKKCRKCKILFYCWGGCSHYRFAKNMAYNCLYHKSNLDQLIRITYEINKIREENKKYILF